jgi:uncharacterized protein
MKRFLLHLLASILLFLHSHAANYPQRPDPPRLVNDLSGILTAEQVNALEQELDAFSDTASSQIAVVSVTTIGDQEINQYATELAQQWGIGQKGKDNGVLLLIATDDRKACIVTGYGVEEFLPDAICKRIITRILVPAFKEQDYYGGISRGVHAAMDRLSGKFDTEGDVKASTKKPINGFVIVLIVLVVVFLLMRSKGGGGGGRTYGGRGFYFIPGPRFGGGGFGGFGGGGSSGGFGGFGGGSFGGGGASGSW